MSKLPTYDDFFSAPSHSRRTITPPPLPPEEMGGLVLHEPGETHHSTNESPKRERMDNPKLHIEEIPIYAIPSEYEPSTQTRVAVSRSTIDRVVRRFTWKIYKHGPKELPYFKSNTNLTWRTEIPNCNCGAALRAGPRLNYIRLNKDGNSISCPKCKQHFPL